MRPVGIGETLRLVLAKIVMMAAGDQAKTACGNLQLRAGLKASIEGATHAVVQRRVERVRERREEPEEEENAEAEGGEEESGVVDGLTNNLNIETACTEEKAAERMSEARRMESVEQEGSEGEEGGRGTLRALEDLEFLTQEEELSGTTLVDACNAFNKLSRLTMLWTVRH